MISNDVTKWHGIYYFFIPIFFMRDVVFKGMLTFGCKT